MKKILITGGNGQLGSELNVLSNTYSQFEWVFTDYQELDLCDLENLESNISKINPQLIINCAAHTAVDKAESEIELSDVLNHQSVAIMAKWSQENNCQFIHVSTDYVFDGNSSKALTETGRMVGGWKKADSNKISGYQDVQTNDQPSVFPTES